MKFEIDRKELEERKERNWKQRLEFVKQYARWVKKTPNEEWSEQQNKLID